MTHHTRAASSSEIAPSPLHSTPIKSSFASTVPAPALHTLQRQIAQRCAGAKARRTPQERSSWRPAPLRWYTSEAPAGGGNSGHGTGTASCTTPPSLLSHPSLQRPCASDACVPERERKPERESASEWARQRRRPAMRVAPAAHETPAHRRLHINACTSNACMVSLPPCCTCLRGIEVCVRAHTQATT